MKNKMLKVLFMFMCVFMFSITSKALSSKSLDDIVLIEGNGKKIQTRIVYYNDVDVPYYLYGFDSFSVDYNNLENIIYSDYNKISDEKKTLIGKYINYGYLYKDHTSIDWYKVTQIMIWRTLYDNYDINFVSNFGGNKIDKYTELFKELNNIVNDTFDDAYYVDYNDNFLLDFDTDKYECLDNGIKIDNNKINIPNIKSNYAIFYYEKGNEELKSPLYYVNDGKNDVFIRAGRAGTPRKYFNVYINKSTVTFGLKVENKYFSLNKDKSNVCYGLYREDDDFLVKEMCFPDNNIYGLPLANTKYYYKRTHEGTGYIEDNKKHYINVTKDETIVFELQEIYRNIHAETRVCIDDVCKKVGNLVFYLYDHNGIQMNKMYSDDEGNLNFSLGYGEYTIEQMSGVKGFKIGEPINFKIDKSGDNININIVNNQIIKNNDEDNKKDDKDKDEDNLIKGDIDIDNSKNEENSNNDNTNDNDFNDINNKYYDETVDNPYTGSKINIGHIAKYLYLSFMFNYLRLRAIFKK